MTSSAFAQAIREMKGLDPSAIEQLTELAEELTDKERATTVKIFEKVNMKILADLDSASALDQEGTKAIQEFLRKDVPPLRRARENRERAEDVSVAEKKLRKL